MTFLQLPGAIELAVMGLLIFIPLLLLLGAVALLRAHGRGGDDAQRLDDLERRVEALENESGDE